MERVRAGHALLVGHLPLAADDAVADGALDLALQHALDVALQHQQALDQVVVGELDDALRLQEPGAPLALGDGDAIGALDEGGGEGEGRGEPDSDEEGLVVDGLGEDEGGGEGDGV